MDKDYRYYQAKIRDAERLRSDALGELLAAGWLGLTRTAARTFRSLTDSARAGRPVHH
ncbi:MAG: hypothetical protein ROZ37_16845 [Aromatoleum sp.]|jgi:hypothetical protein|uniref:hypothetical protein n=1 Tax=Aromatoleum sp. TaxID=2307007 RepID=UPI002895D43F|nr:hypothetical protein [Aromatoleum sp.]MDT3671989.1 hypothetical protein [Aromatoleum sp.]